MAENIGGAPDQEALVQLLWPWQIYRTADVVAAHSWKAYCHTGYHQRYDNTATLFHFTQHAEDYYQNIAAEHIRWARF